MALRLGANRTISGVAAYLGVATAYNLAYPLNIVWDLDETLISSQLLDQQTDVPPGTVHPHRVLDLQPGKSVTHIDDDAMTFATVARPHACALLSFFRFLPGCHQYVSTAASPGYASNVSKLLDPHGVIFRATVANRSSRGKDVFEVLPPGCDGSLRRTVLVDNRSSCHSPQPMNGLVVTDFDSMECEVVLADESGTTVGTFPAAIAKRSFALERNMPPTGPFELASLMDGGSTLAGRVAAVARGSGTCSDLADRAKALGASALLVRDHRREISAPGLSGNFALPVISVGGAAGRLVESRTARNVAVVKRSDKELVRVFRRLLLCWLLPHVHWALDGDASKDIR